LTSVGKLGDANRTCLSWSIVIPRPAHGSGMYETAFLELYHTS
jgi:hypothetical protein